MQTLAPPTQTENARWQIVWLGSALWLGLALAASLISIRIAVSVALGRDRGRRVCRKPHRPAHHRLGQFLAGFGAILLTFLAGTEIDPRIVRKHFWSSMSIGIMGFFAPYLGVLAMPIGGFTAMAPGADRGISLSTTSVAVVYAV